jgi:hypothetical protein
MWQLGLKLTGHDAKLSCVLVQVVVWWHVCYCCVYCVVDYQNTVKTLVHKLIAGGRIYFKNKFKSHRHPKWHVLNSIIIIQSYTTICLHYHNTLLCYCTMATCFGRHFMTIIRPILNPICASCAHVWDPILLLLIVTDIIKIVHKFKNLIN